MTCYADDLPVFVRFGWPSFLIFGLAFTCSKLVGALWAIL
jgi:hypothetical protein